MLRALMNLKLFGRSHHCAGSDISESSYLESGAPLKEPSGHDTAWVLLLLLRGRSMLLKPRPQSETALSGLSGGANNPTLVLGRARFQLQREDDSSLLSLLARY